MVSRVETGLLDFGFTGTAWSGPGRDELGANQGEVERTVRHPLFQNLAFHSDRSVHLDGFVVQCFLAVSSWATGDRTELWVVGG